MSSAYFMVSSYGVRCRLYDERAGAEGTATSIHDWLGPSGNNEPVRRRGSRAITTSILARWATKTRSCLGAHGTPPVATDSTAAANRTVGPAGRHYAPIASFIRFSISSDGTSSTWEAMFQRWPKGSSNCPVRSP